MDILTLPFASKHTAIVNVGGLDLTGLVVEFYMELGINSGTENFLVSKTSADGGIIIYDDLDPGDRPSWYTQGDIGIVMNVSDYKSGGTITVYSNEELLKRKVKDQYKGSILIRENASDTNPINIPIDLIRVSHSAWSPST